MRIIPKKNWIGRAVAVLLAASTPGAAQQPPVTLSIVPIGGTTVSDGSTVAVEVFLTANVTIGIRGGWFDLPCSLPGKPGSTGSISILPGGAGGTVDPDGDGCLGPSSGGIPFLFGCGGGLGPYSPAPCIMGNFGLEIPLTLQAGTTRYAGTLYYQVDACAAGDFNIFFECSDQPGGMCDSIPEATNTTRYRDYSPACAGLGCLIPLQTVGTTLHVANCCEGGPLQACCLDGGCIDLDALCCLAQGGSRGEFGTLCTTTQACCLADGTCTEINPHCCLDQGGSPGGLGTQCSAPQACCHAYAVCTLHDPLCCIVELGTPKGAGSTCDAPEICCDVPPAGGGGLPVVEPALYWTDYFDQHVRRSRLDGSGTVTLLTVGNSPSGIALDLVAGHVYWAENGYPQGTIRRADLNGSNVMDVVTTGLATLGVALDLAAEKLWWTEFGSIRRADLDGSDAEVVLSSDFGFPRAIALDPVARKVYCALGGILRADYDGMGIETLVPFSSGSVQGLALDLFEGWMYWTQQNPGGVRRARLDGSNIQHLVDAAYPEGIALPFAGKMYWVDGFIRRADLDGSNVEDFVEAYNAFGLALTVSLQPVDCQPNGLADFCELFNETATDCNANELPDECDLARRSSNDLNENGVPDECEVCGNGTCGPLETACTCAQDCGPPTPEVGDEACSDGVDNDCDGAGDCADVGCAASANCAIPTVSTWGVVMLSLCLLAAGKIYFSRRELPAV